MTILIPLRTQDHIWVQNDCVKFYKNSMDSVWDILNFPTPRNQFSSNEMLFCKHNGNEKFDLGLKEIDDLKNDFSEMLRS